VQDIYTVWFVTKSACVSKFTAPSHPIQTGIRALADRMKDKFGSTRVMKELEKTEVQRQPTLNGS
jgi:hypothetical protein